VFGACCAWLHGLGLAVAFATGPRFVVTPAHLAGDRVRFATHNAGRLDVLGVLFDRAVVSGVGIVCRAQTAGLCLFFATFAAARFWIFHHGTTSHCPFATASTTHHTPILKHSELPAQTIAKPSVASML
jgi:hypothetical protein